MTSKHSKLAVAAGVLLLAGSAPVLAAGPAHAGVAEVTCVAGSDTVTYSPGVTFTSAPVLITDSSDLGACVSTDPAITTGTNRHSFTAVRSCLNLDAAGAGTYVITWNDGETSTLSLNYAVNTIAGSVISTGTGNVTSGLFSGDAAVLVNTGPVINALNCLGTGITSRTGTVTLEITSA